jgi:hypothetical protein
MPTAFFCTLVHPTLPLLCAGTAVVFVFPGQLSALFLQGLIAGVKHCWGAKRAALKMPTLPPPIS